MKKALAAIAAAAVAIAAVVGFKKKTSSGNGA